MRNSNKSDGIDYNRVVASPLSNREVDCCILNDVDSESRTREGVKMMVRRKRGRRWRERS